MNVPESIKILINCFFVKIMDAVKLKTVWKNTTAYQRKHANNFKKICNFHPKRSIITYLNKIAIYGNILIENDYSRLSNKV